MNLVMIIIDSLRADHVGINGNPWIQTPSLDKFARDSVRFTRAYPESLPTVQVRRAVHTGKRVYPFRDWTPYKPAPIPGWTPLPEADITMAEILQGKGYRTAFITDVYHMFRPGMNFHRGFDEWQFIRGQEFDVYRSGSQKPVDIGKHLTSKMDKNRLPAKMMAHYLRNVEMRQGEEDYFAPQVFSTAMRWLEENYTCDNFFLCIDCFDPHEPWDPPRYYRDMYDPGYDGVEIILPFYSENLDYMTEAELKHVRALYAGEVTMVDTWLGMFLNKMDQLGLTEDTVFALFSDHGHLLGENGYMGKPPSGLYPGLMDLVFMIKAPGQGPTKIDSFVYDHDLFPTLLSLLGEEIPEQSEGENLWDLVTGKTDSFRDYVTSALKTWLWVRDGKYAMIQKSDGSVVRLYDLVNDPTCADNIAGDHPQIVDKMAKYLVADAGGGHSGVPGSEVVVVVWQ